MMDDSEMRDYVERGGVLYPSEVHSILDRLAAAEATIAEAVGTIVDWRQGRWPRLSGPEILCTVADRLSAYRPVAAHPEVESND